MVSCKSIKGFGKKAVVLASALSILSFGSPVFADTKGYKVEESESIETIDKIVLDNAAKSKTVIFSEAHIDSIDDSRYVTSLLPELKRLGYNYLALEIKRRAKDRPLSRVYLNHAQTIMKFVENYQSNKDLDLRPYCSDSVKDGLIW